MVCQGQKHLPHDQRLACEQDGDIKRRAVPSDPELEAGVRTATYLSCPALKACYDPSPPWYIILFSSGELTLLCAAFIGRTPGAPGSWQADAPPCADATQACRRDWLPAGLDACQVFRFHEETYWSLPNSAELSGHQLEITGAVSGCGALLGERVTEQLAPVLMATGAWAFPKAKHDIDCYVAGELVSTCYALCACFTIYSPTGL